MIIDGKIEKPTGRTEMFSGIPCFVPNTTYNLEDEGCYVSYNNHDSLDYGCATTALVKESSEAFTKFLILNGNHVEEYMKLGTYEKCLEYFKQHLDQKNPLSENWDEEDYWDEDGKLKRRKIVK